MKDSTQVIFRFSATIISYEPTTTTIKRKLITGIIGAINEECAISIIQDRYNTVKTKVDVDSITLYKEFILEV